MILNYTLPQRIINFQEMTLPVGEKVLQDVELLPFERLPFVL